MQKRSVLQARYSLEETLEGDPFQVACLLQQAKKTRECLMVHPSTVNRMELGAQEWQDAIFPRYGIEPPDLPKYCDDCNTAFSICQYLDL